MENKYLLDTNVLIYYSNGIFDDSNDLIDQIFQDSFNISVISKIEFLGWAGFRGNSVQYSAAKEFIDGAALLYLDDDVAEETIRVRQEHKVKTPDAIIAATAIVYNLALVTSNVQDFKNIDLELLNPLK